MKLILRKVLIGMTQNNKKQQYTLYLHTFPNNKVYVGITSKDPMIRWGQNGQRYLNRNKSGKYRQPKIANAILKYGWNNVQHKILLQTMDLKQIERAERYYITEVYHSNDIKFGYNIENGGNYIGKLSNETKQKLSSLHKGKKLSENTKRKISEIQKGKKRKPLSQETRDKISKAQLGKIISPETGKKISLANKGKPAWNKGQITSEEIKQKISKSKKGTPSWNKGLRMNDEMRKKMREVNIGLHWWNNGFECKRSKESPGKNWTLGRIIYRKK